MKTKPHKLTRRYLLTQVKKLILSEPKRLTMNSILYRDASEDGPSCGTVGCIAGWLCVVAARKENSLPFQDAINHVSSSASISDACCLLKADENEMERLCFLASWPQSLKRTYLKSTTPLQRARVTARRIDLFLKSGGRK